MTKQIEVSLTARDPLARAARGIALGYVTEAARRLVESEHCPDQKIWPVEDSPFGTLLYTTPEFAKQEAERLKGLFIEMQTIVMQLDGEKNSTWSMDYRWQYELAQAIPLARVWYEERH